MSHENQEPPLLNYMLLVKIRVAIPKPWQVQHEMNIEIGVIFSAKFVPTFVVELYASLKNFNRFFSPLTSIKRRLFAFQQCNVKN